MASTKNINQVKEITQNINDAQAVYLIEYQGLNANQFNELRRQIRQNGGYLQVTKNTLFTIALRDSEQKISLERNTLSDTTATLYATDDVVKPLKALLNYSKSNELPKLKTGFYQGQQLNEARLQALSELPEPIVLMGQLVGMLNSPIQRLVGSLNSPMQKIAIALSEIKKQKETQ